MGRIALCSIKGIITQFSKEISGVMSITLTYAIANKLNSVTLYGGTEQRNLPSGYTQYEYLRSNGTQYIDLGYKGNGNTKVEVKFKYYQTSSATGSGRVFGSRTSSSSNAFAIGTSSGIVSATNNKVFWCYDGQSFYVADGVQFGLDEWKTVIFSATEHKVDGTTYGDDYNITTFETPSNLMLFAFDNNGTVGVGYVDVAYCKLWNNGALVRDLIPCKNGSNVIGMYDRVSETLLTNAGTGTFETGNTATPTPEKPMNIVSNNGVLKVNSQGQIYTDGTTETIEDELSNTATAEMLLKVGDNADEQEILSGNITRKVGIKVLDGTESWTASGNLFYAGIATDALEDTHSCYCTHFKGVATNTSASYDNEIKVGTNATQTVNWTRVQIYPIVGTYSNVTAFKQFLTDQYNAGTPVIVVYPLATSTTETVTGQTLNIQAGTNTIDITQASLNNLELKANYYSTSA